MEGKSEGRGLLLPLSNRVENSFSEEGEHQVEKSSKFWRGGQAALEVAASQSVAKLVPANLPNVSRSLERIMESDSKMAKTTADYVKAVESGVQPTQVTKRTLFLDERLLESFC